MQAGWMKIVKSGRMNRMLARIASLSCITQPKDSS